MSEPRRRRRPQMLEIEAQRKIEEGLSEAPREQALEVLHEEAPKAPREHAPEAPRERELETPRERELETPREHAPKAPRKHKPEKKFASEIQKIQWSQTLETVQKFVSSAQWKPVLEKLKVRAKGAISKMMPPEELGVAPDEKAQVEIELQHAHGSGAAERRKHHEALLRKNRYKHMQLALMVICIVIAVFSLSMIIRILTRSVRTHLTNRELSRKRAELTATPEPPMELAVFAPEETQTEVPTPESTPEPAEMENEIEADAPAAVSTPKKDVVKSTRYHVASGDALKHMAALYEENRDLIGWLRMEEILDLPVMYRDNSYYLKRDFYKNKNEAGTLFLDQNHKFGEKTQNLLLHGHNMKDGTMFGRLTQYLNLSYMKNNPFVHFDTLWREEEYVIFAVLRVSLDVKDEGFFNYFSYPTFASDSEFSAYIRRLQLKSMYAIPIDVAPSDALLTLSTCLDEDRLVIVCRRMRENETRSELRQAIRLAVKQ